MVATEHAADDARGLLVLSAGAHPLFVHRVKDASLDRLEAVPSVGQRAAHDDGHRVVDGGPGELVLDRLWGKARDAGLLAFVGGRPPRCPSSRLPSAGSGWTGPPRHR